MLIICGLLYVLLSLARIAIDIAAFFIVVRMVLSKRHVAWLAPFDTAGQKVVAMASDLGSKVSCRLCLGQPSPNGRLFVALCTLIVAEFVVMVMTGILRYGL